MNKEHTMMDAGNDRRDAVPGNGEADARACAALRAMESAGPANGNAAESEPGSWPVHRRLGELTRKLHDALRGLGLDTKLEAAAQSLPDAQDRLSYIAKLTGQAANRVLTVVEQGQADQAALGESAAGLVRQWTHFDENTLTGVQFDELIARTRTLLNELPARTAATREQLHEIMMAQDFHDLTGQVISRIAGLVNMLETSLLEMLVETKPTRPYEKPAGLSGPVVRATAETAADQGEVDDLLATLGF